MRRSLSVTLTVALLLGGIAALFGVVVLTGKLETARVATAAEHHATRAELGAAAIRLRRATDDVDNLASQFLLNQRGALVRLHQKRLDQLPSLLNHPTLLSDDPTQRATHRRLHDAIRRFTDIHEQIMEPGTEAPKARLARLQGQELVQLRNTIGRDLAELGSVADERLRLQAELELEAAQDFGNLRIAALLGLLLMFAFIFVHVHRRGVAPARKIARAAAALGRGQYELRLDVSAFRELENLADVINRMAESFQRDLEIRTEAERTAQAVERRLRELSDLAPGVIWEVRFDPSTGPEFTYASRAFDDTYDIPRKAVIDDFTALYDAIHPDDRENLAESIERAFAEHADFSNEHRSRRPDGSYRWLRGYARSSQLADGTTVWNGYSVDIHELTELKRKLQTALEESEAASRVKGQFIANVSHEIRTPMNAVLGMTHLCLQTAVTERQREYLEKIETSARALLRMINNVLDSAKIESGRLELEDIDFSLDQVLENVANVINVKAREKGLQLLFDVPAEVPRELVGDGMRLGQILTNLAGNAVKFTDVGEIRINVRVQHRRGDHAELRFEVSDTGVGIPKDKQARLFDQFTQADASTTRQYGGTGLGLSISRQLVEMLGGEITVESDEGMGTTFIFTVRMGVRLEAEDSLNRLAKKLGKLRCLVVDDSRSSREIIAAMLKSYNFKVHSAESGEEALRVIMQNEIDVVFQDWRMPNMDGVETAKRIRSIEGARISIFLMTSYGRDDIPDEVAQSEFFDGMMLLPINASTMMDLLVARLRPELATRRKPKRSRAAVPDFSGRSILVADDSEVNRDLTSEIIGNTGARVLSVSDGDEAVATAGQQSFDLIFLDLNMNRMSGIDAARAIREELGDSVTPIVAMTGHSDQRAAADCRDAGMNGVLVKPIDVEDMYDTIAKHCGPPQSYINDDEEEEDDQVDAVSSLTGVNVRDGLARSNQNAQLYLVLLRKLVARNSNVLPNVEQHVENEQWSEIAAIGHAIKGSAANLSAERIATISRKLENAAGERNPAVVLEIARELQASIRRLGTELPSEEKRESQPTTPLDLGELARIAGLIQTGDTAARRAVAELRDAAGDHEILVQIDTHLGRYEFEKALHLLENYEVRHSA